MKTPPDDKTDKKSADGAKQADDQTAKADKKSESDQLLAAKVIVTNDDETIDVKPDPKQGSSAPAGAEQARPKEQPATVHMPAVGRMKPLAAPTPPPAGGPSMLSKSGKLLDKKVAYRRWLETKTKDELVDMIIWLETTDPAMDVTEKMMKTQSTGVLTPAPSTYLPPDDLKYVRLPVLGKPSDGKPAASWQFVLLNIDETHPPLGLIIDGEISVGRAATGQRPDLDLSPFGASSKGVSRLHAKIRPSPNSLSLIDNESTNGTFCNKLGLTPGVEKPLSDGDVITFGKINFLLRIMKSPGSIAKDDGVRPALFSLACYCYR